MKKIKLLWIVDDRSYVRNHCYQSQLARTLHSKFDVKTITLNDIRMFGRIFNGFSKKYHFTLISCRMRNIVKVIDDIHHVLSGGRIYIYDEDPWQGFIDNSPFKGCYSDIFSKMSKYGLNFLGFLVQSEFWSNFIRDRGMPSKSFQIGILPKLCSFGKSWHSRDILYGFQGSNKGHRQEFFDELKKSGIPVHQSGFTSFKKYLKQARNTKIFIHPEVDPFIVDGKPYPRAGLWGRDIEIAAQGAFVLRNDDPESVMYRIDEIPSIIKFHNVNGVINIIEQILRLGDEGRRELSMRSVSFIRNNNYWDSIADAIWTEDHYS